MVNMVRMSLAETTKAEKATVKYSSITRGL